MWPIAVWLLALVAVWLWGEWLEDRGYDLVMSRTQPFIGGPDIAIGPGIPFALTLAAGSVAYLPIVAKRFGWWQLLLIAWGTAIAWALALTSIRGTEELARPLLRDDDYLNTVPLADRDLLGFLSTFTENILQYPTHVQGHPPGQVVVLTLLSRLGITSETAIALIYVAVATSAIVAVGVTVKCLHGEEMFRRAMPFMVLAPAAVWIATSPDAFFGGVLAWGIALLALATKRPVLAVPAGLVLGFCPFLSYGLLPMGVILLAVLLYKKAWRVAAIAAVSGLAVFVAFALLGFRWDEGAFATRNAWELDMASVRPYWYFIIANLVVLATLVGPAVLAGLPATPTMPKIVRWLIWFAIAGAVLSSASGYMRGEVERIWLPLVFWIALAGAIAGPKRWWISLSIPVALVCQIVIDSPW